MYSGLCATDGLLHFLIFVVIHDSDKKWLVDWLIDGLIDNLDSRDNQTSLKKQSEAASTLRRGGYVSGMLMAMAVTLALCGDSTSAGFPVFFQDVALFAVAVGSATIHAALVHAASIVFCAWIVHCTATKHMSHSVVPLISHMLFFSFWNQVEPILMNTNWPQKYFARKQHI